MSLSFRMVDATGVRFRHQGLERVVLRRRESGPGPGSEVAICLRHAPALLQTEACRVRLVGPTATRTIDCPAGVAEVLDDVVTLVVV